MLTEVICEGCRKEIFGTSLGENAEEHDLTEESL